MHHGSSAKFRRSLRLRLVRCMAGLLLVQSLAPVMAYALMAPADDGPVLSWCRAQGFSRISGDQPSGTARHFKCPACLFYGQLACGAGASGAPQLSLRFNPAQFPGNGAELPVVQVALETCSIRAPPAAL